ncbi:MAG: 50S ribosomal protein L4 [Cyclobacteriaceae bacterium]|nr:50S ribosomal protein L4 [Cyclobacteriaceae bacterium]
MKVTVLKYTGEDTGRTIELPEDIFGLEPNDHAIYLDVKQYLANQRQGTHKSKERADIAASTRKIKKQKGTGTARAGSMKSPLFKGGGRVFGPKPRDYSFKLNKKLKRLARKSALSYKAAEKNVTVVEDFDFDAPKTKNYLKMLADLSLADKKTLLILEKNNKNILLSGRNVKRANILTADQLHTYHLLHADSLIFSESSIDQLNSTLN